MRRTIVSALLTVVAASLLAAPIAPAAAATTTHTVETRHGPVYVEVTLPPGSGKFPTIFTYSPYAPETDAETRRWTEPTGGALHEGYARVWASVLGTGNSGGCYDYGGKRERESAYDLVEWIADQKWSNGKVGMYGESLAGAAAVAAAAEHPPHLSAIVTYGAPTSWYDLNYGGGIRYLLNNEMLSHHGATALNRPLENQPLYNLGLALAPPTDVQGEGWPERFQSSVTPCEDIDYVQRGYDDTPDYDGFWAERDYVRAVKESKIPALIGHNWGDPVVKSDHPVDLFRALPNAKLFMGSRWAGHDVVHPLFGAFADHWMEAYVGRSGSENLPTIISEQATQAGAGKLYRGAWPKTKEVELVAQQIIRTQSGIYEWQVLPAQPSPLVLQRPLNAQFPSVGINTESHAAHHCRNNHDWWCFQTPQLTRDVRIFGEVKVQIWSTVYRKWVTFTPSIIDVDPSVHQSIANTHATLDPKQLVGVTRGWLDSRYRNGLSKQAEVTPGKSFGMTVVAKPMDYTFAKGHIIQLNIQTEINEWSLPKLDPDCQQVPDPTVQGQQDCTQVRINWEQGKTRLILPVVNAPKDVHSLFGGTHH